MYKAYITVKPSEAYPSRFPASRGLSRRDKQKREERDLCRFRRVSYLACPRVSLTTSDVFVTCDTTQRTGLDLSTNAGGC